MIANAMVLPCHFRQLPAIELLLSEFHQLPRPANRQSAIGNRQWLNRQLAMVESAIANGETYA
jgi:hypothetical protein